MGDRNVLGGELEPCGADPLMSFHRDGCCNTGPEDLADRARRHALDHALGQDVYHPPHPIRRITGVSRGACFNGSFGSGKSQVLNK
ncbi:MAG TPA: DUF2237 family protein [Streptosporangiaceae bacterium]